MVAVRGAACLLLLSLAVAAAGCEHRGTGPTAPEGTAWEGDLSLYRSSASRDFKAFAIDPYSGQSGWAWGYRHPDDAIARALRNCRSKAGLGCRLYMVGPTNVEGMAPESLERVARVYYERMVANRERLPLDQRALTNAQIEAAFSPSIAAVVTDHAGQKAAAAIGSDGRISVMLDRDPVVGRRADRGTWWAENDRMCHRFAHWYNGKTHCMRLAWDRNVLKGYSDDGVLVATIEPRLTDDRPAAPATAASQGPDGRWRGVATTTNKSGGWVCTQRFGLEFTISGGDVSGSFDGEIDAEGRLSASDEGYQRNAIYDGRIVGGVAEGKWRVVGACSGSWRARKVAQ